MKRDRLFYGLVGLMLVAVLVLAMGGEVQRQTRLIPNRTTYSSDPGGCKALYMTLFELGVRARRYGGSLEAMPDGRALLLISPRGMARQDWLQVSAWVQRGHLAVVALDQPQELLAPPQQTGSGAAELGPGEGVETVPAWGRWRIPDGVSPDEDPWSLADFPPEVLSRAVPVATDRQGVVAAWASWGHGDFLLLQSAWGLANQCLGKGDDLELLLNAFERFPGDGPIWFEEAHHGYADSTGGLWDVLPASVRIGLGQIGLAILLGLIYLGTRTRRPVPLPGMERSRAEYLASLAGLLGRARAVPVALQEEAAAFPPDLVDAESEALLREAQQPHSEAQALALVRRLREIERKAKEQV